MSCGVFMENTNKSMINSDTVSSIDELQQILRLQQINLTQNISSKEKSEQGFVTMIYTLETLQSLHQLAPSVIIKDDDKVIAYALVFLKEGRQIYPGFEPMFTNFEKLSWKGSPLNNYKFYVMGQICVAKEYRGKGMVELLYQKHKELFQDKFDFIVTEISTNNLRSIKAHHAVGFKTINIHTDHKGEWEVVLWDWNSPSSNS